MKISYIMIVLNGMPFIEFSLKAIYDSAYEIIIIEGAVKDCMFAANHDGSSIDGTVEFIHSFPDPGGKIKIIQGRWPEKREMQNAAMQHVSGDYVWLVDADEVYHKNDIQTVITLLEHNDIMELVLPFYPFWKGFEYYMFCPPVAWSRSCPRVFKYIPGATFTRHRPITMQWPPGNKGEVASFLMREVHFFHYSYVLDSQVQQKISLYKTYRWDKIWHISLDDWYNECFLKWTPENREEIEKVYPIWTANRNSYTRRFVEGTHPEVMLEYIEKFKRGER